jgi:hypothetical protein
MTKFRSNTDSGYIRVRDQLWLWVNALSQGNESSGSSQQMQVEVEDSAQPPGEERSKTIAPKIEQGCEGTRLQDEERATIGSVSSGGGPIFMGNVSAGRDFHYH